MTREILLIQHGLSKADTHESEGRIKTASDNAESPLISIGINQARKLGEILLTNYNVQIGDIMVATSSMKRAQQTAIEAGANYLCVYPVLNDIWDDTMTDDERKIFREKLRNNIISKNTVNSTEKILSDPPDENIWFTHASIIAGLCKKLGKQNEYEQIVPKFCEIRRIEID